MLVFVIKLKKKKVVWHFTVEVFLCQNFLTNSNVYRKNNFPSAYYLLDLMVSIVPAKKNLFQCKGPPLSVFLIFCFWKVKAFTSEPFSATCVWREQKCIWHHQQRRLSKKMGAGRCLVGTWRGEAGKGCWGAPQGFGGAVRGPGGSLAGSWHTLLLGRLGPCPHSGKAAVGAAGRVPACTTPCLQSLPRGVQWACCMHSPTQMAKSGGGYPRYLHKTPEWEPAGRTGWQCFLLSPREAGFAACARGQPGGCSHLFPQLVLVNDAFQLLCELCVLLAELHVPLALLLDLSLDFTQRALEMISYFFPLLIFLPCPLNCFLLLLNGRERSHVSKMHNKQFQKDTVSE